jgi:exo-beta-1,3-glucanase (GH17 family)
MKFKFDNAINYSGYRNGQSPLTGVFPTKSEILQDLKILENQYYYLRLFDCSKHAYIVLDLIESNKLNFKVMLGLSLAAESNYENHPYFYTFTKKDLDNHKKSNKNKIQEIIMLGNKYKHIVSSISIGNEVQSPWANNFINEDRLVEIAKAIQEGTKLPVTFCEEYQYWVNGLDKLANQVDFISLHTYPAWRNCPIEEALKEAIKNYGEVKSKYPDKTLIITETGWPTKSHGAKIKVNDANVENQQIYTTAIQDWAKENEVLVYLFEAFDEPWKGGSHANEPEKNWGLYYVDRTKKW